MNNKLNFLCMGIICALFACIHTAEINEGLSRKEVENIEKDVTMKCGEKYQVNGMEAHSFFMDRTFSPPVTKNLKCFFGCVLHNMGLIINNKLDWEKMKLERKLMASQDMDTELKIIDSCQAKVKNAEELCEVGYSLADCVRNEFAEEIKSILNTSDLPLIELGALVVCQRKLNISDADAFSIADGKPKTHEVKCLMRCFDESMGLVNRSSKKYDWAFREKLDRMRFSKKPEAIDKSLEMVRNCEKTVNMDVVDECESSYLIMECYMEQYRKASI